MRNVGEYDLSSVKDGAKLDGAQKINLANKRLDLAHFLVDSMKRK